ncbi:hypothetical protein CCACVL1_24561 [Corchorus capsularis]|uniref:RNase H type-1 domain-containing protein n=1 Tax=Corchorus capsularis TaxID=210143 RepID=A0A1R3GP29_COCAP|nr:hypothetical protein CCACVL1_24561 [Corchorus capsularis]
MFSCSSSSMAEEKDAFYVIKKGDVFGVYRSLSDVHRDVKGGHEIYKGYGLSREAESHLDSLGLKNAAYSISASDVNDSTFGKLFRFRPQQPSYGGTTSNRDPSPNRVHQELAHYMEHRTMTNQIAAQMMASNSQFCIVEFDGASKGNPGPAGAGAILRTEDGRVICRLCEGVGIATNNEAEYRAAILGMKYALQQGFKHIRVKGDSNLVCMQVKGLWKINSRNLVELNSEAMELKDMFISFHIDHIGREWNSEADALANRAVNLGNGQVQEYWAMQ